MRRILLVVVLLLAGCSDIESVVNDEETVAHDVSCADGQEYLVEEMICAMPLTCEGEDCAAVGDAFVVQLQEQYGSLIEEESVMTEEDF